MSNSDIRLKSNTFHGGFGTIFKGKWLSICFQKGHKKLMGKCDKQNGFTVQRDVHLKLNGAPKVATREGAVANKTMKSRNSFGQRLDSKCLVICQPDLA